MATLEQDLSLLTLEEEEVDEGTEIQELEEIVGDEGFALCAIGKILTNKPINFVMFQNRIADIWRPYKGIQISKLEEDRILFRFFHELDLRWVLENSPWTYESCLIVMAEIQQGQVPMQISLVSTEFWVQGYKMPSSYCTAAVGRVVGDHVGKFVAMDEEHKFTLAEPYMRVRVQLDTRTPLKREKKD
ncbi:hypothetical protein LINGRAHAP2_LOCUS9740 [Linum grandiflorum]